MRTTLPRIRGISKIDCTRRHLVVFKHPVSSQLFFRPDTVKVDCGDLGIVLSRLINCITTDKLRGKYRVLVGKGVELFCEASDFEFVDIIDALNTTDAYLVPKKDFTERAEASTAAITFPDTSAGIRGDERLCGPDDDARLPWPHNATRKMLRPISTEVGPYLIQNQLVNIQIDIRDGEKLILKCHECGHVLREQKIEFPSEVLGGKTPTEYEKKISYEEWSKFRDSKR